MRFTVIGHSCLYIETDAGTVLVDPWLIGSCYWRAWWHYPPSSDPRPEWLRPDYIALTHHHFDHFHYPSMRRLDRDATVLIPEFGVDVMEGELRGLGFDRVTEIPNGAPVALGAGTRVGSFQYGFDDSTFVVSDGTTTLVDMNDCKMRGRAARRITERFGRPTFLFKNFSWSQSYPLCYTAEDPRDLELLSRDSYLEDFVGRVEELSPRYGVPFGSMVAFLHPECRDLNQHLITPDDVAAAFAARATPAPAGAPPGSEVVPMSPGDSWGSGDGFHLAAHDWYTRREEHLAELERAVAPKLAEQAEAEAGRTLAFDAFRAYFGHFVRALPPGTGRFVVRRPFVFEVPSSDLPYWVVDVPRRAVYRLPVAPPDRLGIVHVPEAVLADAIDKRVMHVVHGSMRIRTDLARGGASGDLAIWGLLAIWELGYLDPATWFTRRFARVAWSRRVEVLEALAALRGSGTFLERMAGRFREPDAVPAADTGA